jgi:hypothetical protein
MEYVVETGKDFFYEKKVKILFFPPTLFFSQKQLQYCRKGEHHLDLDDLQRQNSMLICYKKSIKKF